MVLRRVAISVGDPAGIGPEIALKAALDERVRRIARPLLVGDRRVIEAHASLSGLAPRFNAFRSAAEHRRRRIREDRLIHAGPARKAQMRIPNVAVAGLPALMSSVDAAAAGQEDRRS